MKRYQIIVLCSHQVLGAVADDAYEFFAYNGQGVYWRVCLACTTAWSPRPPWWGTPRTKSAPVPGVEREDQGGL